MAKPKECHRCKRTECICTEIRASSLVSTECWRQWAVNNETLRPWFKKFGYDDIQPDQDNAGSVLGDACHKGIGAYMLAKMQGFQADPLSHALTAFHSRMKDKKVEDFQDKVTPNNSVAVQQIERMLQEISPYIRDITPQRVEFRVEAAVDREKHIYVTGHPDCFEDVGIVDDWKFGKNLSAYDAQLGAYSLMLRSTEGVEVSGLRVLHVPRRSMKSKLWKCDVILYDKFKSEELAQHLIYDAAERIERFKETGDLWSFTPNPNHNLCSRRWCESWGTKACAYGRPEKQTSEED